MYKRQVRGRIASFFIAQNRTSGGGGAAAQDKKEYRTCLLYTSFVELQGEQDRPADAAPVTEKTYAQGSGSQYIPLSLIHI